MFFVFCVIFMFYFFFFKQKTAYEMRISDWSSDVCSSDLPSASRAYGGNRPPDRRRRQIWRQDRLPDRHDQPQAASAQPPAAHRPSRRRRARYRSEEHTSELQSLMRISYAVFCLKKKKPNTHNRHMLLNIYTYTYTLTTH